MEARGRRDPLRGENLTLGIHVEDLRFRYPTERFELAFRALEVESGSRTAIIGPSGCGKSTLLKLLAGILRPTAGRIRVLDEAVSDLGDAAARRFRIRRLGLVFQEFELLEYLTTTENILLPFRVTNALVLTDEVHERVGELAAATGIEHLLTAYPRAMSQGERQRVAICRALVTKPELILADEPTGSLDPENQRRIVELILSTARTAKIGVLMVTHDHGLLESFDRVVDIRELQEGAR